MKKKRIYICFLLAVFVLSACKRTEDSIFDMDPSNRLNEAVQHAYHILQGSPNGWMMKYYPASSMEFGGYTLFVDFLSDKDATLTSDINKDAITSSYAVIAEGGPVLTFNGYNKVIHYFSEPGADSGVGAQDSGLRGDFEFVIIEATPEKVTLKGKKSGSVIEMFPLSNDAPQIIEDYQHAADFFGQFRMFKIERPNGTVEDLILNYRAFNLSSDANLPQISVRVIPSGLELLREYELDGVKFNTLYYNEPTAEFEWGYYTDDSKQIKIFPLTTPLNVWMKSNLWGMSFSNVGAVGKTSWSLARILLALNGLTLNKISIGFAGASVILYEMQGGALVGAVGHDIIAVEGTDDEVIISMQGSVYDLKGGFNASLWNAGLSQFTVPLDGKTFVITTDGGPEPSEILLTEKTRPNNTFRLILGEINDPFNN